MTIDQHAQPPQPTLPRRRVSSPAGGSAASGATVSATAPAGDPGLAGEPGPAGEPGDDVRLEDVPVLIELPDLTWHRSPAEVKSAASKRTSTSVRLQVATAAPPDSRAAAQHTRPPAVVSHPQTSEPAATPAESDSDLASPRQLNEQRRQRRDAVLAAGDRQSTLRAHAISGFVVALVAVAAFWAYRQQQENSPADGRSLAQQELEPWDEPSPRIDFDGEPATSSTDVPPALPAPAMFLKPDRSTPRYNFDQKTAANDRGWESQPAQDNGADSTSNEASRMTFGSDESSSNTTAGLDSMPRQPDSRPASYISSRPEEYRSDRPSSGSSAAPETYESYESSGTQPASYPVFTIPKRENGPNRENGPKRENGFEPAAGGSSTSPGTSPSTSRSGAWSYEPAGEFGGSGDNYPSISPNQGSWSGGQPAASPTGTYPSTSDPNPPRYPRTNW